MGFWAKSLRIVNYLCAAGTQSVRHIAQHTGLSKTSGSKALWATVRCGKKYCAIQKLS
jgi:hypothetical protein